MRALLRPLCWIGSHRWHKMLLVGFTGAYCARCHKVL